MKSRPPAPACKARRPSGACSKGDDLALTTKDPAGRVLFFLGNPLVQLGDHPGVMSAPRPGTPKRSAPSKQEARAFSPVESTRLGSRQLLEGDPCLVIRIIG